MHPRIINFQDDDGFSLAETAIVLAILALVIGTLVPSFLSIRLAEQAKQTNDTLQTVMRSIAGFVQSSGCVPCPMPAGSAYGNGHGLVRGEGGANCATCANSVGIVPFRSLGLPENFAKDAYGHWLTYAVDARLAGYTATAPSNALPVSGTNGLCGLAYSAAQSVNVTLSNGSLQNNIAVLLLSHGANGKGAYRNNPEHDSDRIQLPSQACAADSGAERCNADDNRSFVAALAAQSDDPFDDVMLYLNRNALVTFLGNAPCTTVWQ